MIDMGIIIRIAFFLVVAVLIFSVVQHLLLKAEPGAIVKASFFLFLIPFKAKPRMKGTTWKALLPWFILVVVCFAVALAMFGGFGDQIYALVGSFGNAFMDALGFV